MPEIGPTEENQTQTRDRLLTDPLGSLSENSSIRLKSTTPSLQNPGRQSPSIELTIFSESSDQKNWYIPTPSPLFDSESRLPAGYDPVASEPPEDKFMTPVKLPPPGFKQSPEPGEPAGPVPLSRSPSPNPFKLLMATESPYKMPPAIGGKISRSQSQRDLSDSGSPDHSQIAASSIPATKSMSTFSEIQLDIPPFSGFASEIPKRIRDKCETLLHEASAPSTSNG